MVTMKDFRKPIDDNDLLWEGTPVCPECDSPLIHAHIRERTFDFAVIDWFCDDCGHKWSACCPFDSEHGVITTV